MLASSRASGAPRQKWMPLPKARACASYRGECRTPRDQRIAPDRGSPLPTATRPGSPPESPHRELVTLAGGDTRTSTGPGPRIGELLRSPAGADSGRCEGLRVPRDARSKRNSAFPIRPNVVSVPATNRPTTSPRTSSGMHFPGRYGGGRSRWPSRIVGLARRRRDQLIDVLVQPLQGLESARRPRLLARISSDHRPHELLNSRRDPPREPRRCDRSSRSAGARRSPAPGRSDLGRRHRRAACRLAAWPVSA